VTILLKDEIQAGNYPLSYEMQFGEWLREELKEGGTLSSQKDPDISILLRKARSHHTVLFGPALDQWAPEISDQELWQAMSDTYPEIVAHW
ncbi:adenylyltransferase, partial [Acinetobacter baumannii]|nr:adenylyltransferase [Acinetobacter baumannii]